MMFPNLHKKVENLAQHKDAPRFLFPLAFFEAMLFPIPPEVLIAALLSFREDLSWKRLAIISALGSLCGALSMYAIGYFLYDSIGFRIVESFNFQDEMTKAETVFQTHAFIYLIVAAFTVLPDRIFTLAAGVFSVPLYIFIPGIFLGRYLRAAIVAYLADRFGHDVKKYMVMRTETALLFLAIIIFAVVYFVY